MTHRAFCQIIVVFSMVFCAGFRTAFAQANDSTYAEKIKEYTTDSKYLNEMVDHLPQSETVPSPLQHFGTIIGAPGVLHYTDEIYSYYRALAAASPRVAVRTIGQTEEGRDMLEVVVADEETIANLETYRAYLNQLADPRQISEAQAREIIDKARPIYYITAGLHSPETGPPEMLMELAYRLAVEESPLTQAIRANVILMLVPVAEPDGRDRMVDTYNYRKAHKEVGPNLVYWGHYVAHDNNRDGFGLTLALTRNILKAFLHWKPTIMHDLHESVPYLYVSTGTGPYNEYIDPITINEWHNLAYEEVTELTKRGMPGVWTHGFYNGWAANYLMWIANTHNATGRFYETFGNAIAETKERKLKKNQTSVKWYRTNPPLKKTMWSLRNNTNYMESGVLTALKYTAEHRRNFVENFYIKTKKAIAAGKEGPPYAWVIPGQQRRPIATANLVNLLLEQGVEVQQATEKLKWSEPVNNKAKGGKKQLTDGKAGKKEKPRIKTAAKGAFVVRMDQPYRTLVRVLLDKQNFPKDERPPYDDTGWSLPLLHQVAVYAVNDSTILSAKMSPVEHRVRVQGRLEGKGKPYYLLNNNTEDNVAVFRFKLTGVPMLAAEFAFEVGKHPYNAGTLIVPVKDKPADLLDRLQRTAAELGLELRGVSSLPKVPTHAVEVPRVALVHTWVATPQDAGWWQYAFDHLGIPYAYLSEQDLADTDLSGFDVVIMPRTWASPQQLVAGTTEVGDPIPWQQNETFKHIGVIDQTSDMRKGMGYEGVQNLKTFVKNGGVFITEGSTAAFPIDMAITRRISIKRTKELQARGTVLKAVVKDTLSPIIYGYGDSLAVYFNQAPVFKINKRVGSYATPDWLKDALWAQEVPRVIMSFPRKRILLSGMLRGEKELADAPAVVDVPVGQGHVVLFAIRPFWRWETRGSHALVFNTLLHWNDLRVGWPKRPEEEEEETPAHYQEGWWEWQ
ncbi:MAG: M14 family zinc carboxypeptidase [bacterium]